MAKTVVGVFDETAKKCGRQCEENGSADLWAL